MAKLCVVFLFVLLYFIQEGKCSNTTTEAIKLESTLTTEKAILINETTQTVQLDTILDQTLLEDKSESRDFGVSLLIGGTLAAIIIVPILLLVLLVLFVPVPGLFFPASTLGLNHGVLVTGRQLTSKLMDKFTPETVEAFRGMMESDICVQRVSCEIMKASKEYNMDRWLYGIMNDIPVGQSLKRKITRGAQFTRNCRRFSCDPLASVWKMFT